MKQNAYNVKITFILTNQVKYVLHEPATPHLQTV